MILQLNPPLPLTTSRGAGLAHFLIDYGAEHHLLWVIADDATGECWTLPNPEVRFTTNITMGRTSPDKLDATALPSTPIRESYNFARNVGDREFLKWIYNRLVQIHGESPDVDYIRVLKMFADNYDGNVHVHNWKKA